MQYLSVRSGAHTCGLPLAAVIEVFRPLPIQALGRAPAFVLGLTQARGEALPVVDLRRLLGDQPQQAPERFVSLQVGGRRMILAVDQVLGLAWADPDALAPLPPLLTPSHPAVEALAALDPSLLLMLSGASLLPELPA
jgi:chemotaxis signal transduction protein